MHRKRVFILTPSSGFGTLIHQVLEDTGAYQPFLFYKSKDILDQTRKDAVALIVLDAELGNQTSPEFIAELREHAPHARLLIIPSEENPVDPNLKLFGADAILPSPFYLPDLIAVIEQYFGPIVPKDTPKLSSFGNKVAQVETPLHTETRPPVWLEDVTQAARYLTRLTLESASRAALITKGDKPWAYAGELPTNAADELAAAVSEHAANRNQADLARFIHLKATDVDYMLYATSLGGDFNLALAFDTQMPFSQMRSQVSELAKALVTTPHVLLAREQVLSHQTEPQHAELHMQAGESEPPAPRSHRAAEPDLPAPIPDAPQPKAKQETRAASTPDLTYSFVLIPRLPKHRLEGDLAENLAVWLPELCLAFAWRLEHISVQADFLSWTINMPPSTAPESAAQTLDHHLSKNIFEDYPHLARENPSGHFWAQGYLIVNAAQPSPERISDYIAETRARQGVPR